ncbi:MAG: hypothetical protein J7K23_04170 [Thermoproteales archaeon]|nr:hypothetical protein [Thermoproteales archaeon]
MLEIIFLGYVVFGLGFFILGILHRRDGVAREMMLYMVMVNVFLYGFALALYSPALIMLKAVSQPYKFSMFLNNQTVRITQRVTGVEHIYSGDGFTVYTFNIFEVLTVFIGGWTPTLCYIAGRVLSFRVPRFEAPLYLLLLKYRLKKKLYGEKKATEETISSLYRRITLLELRQDYLDSQIRKLEKGDGKKVGVWPEVRVEIE